MSFEDDKNKYMLRDGCTHVVNNRVLVGPEVLTMDLDDAYEIVHKLERPDLVRAAYKKKNHDKLRKQQIEKRVAAYMRAGASKPEAIKKAEAAILKKEEREERESETAAVPSATESPPPGEGAAD